MDKISIELFCKEYDISCLPAYKALSFGDIKIIISRLNESFNWNYSARQIFDHIEKNGNVIFKLNDDNECSFRLDKQLAENNIFDDDIIVFWRDVEADVFRCADFSTYFTGLWWPRADDFLIVDTSCKWCLDITHYGDVILLASHGIAGKESDPVKRIS